MAHGTSTNSLELSGDTKLFDRVARKWNVDYAFYQTEPGKYLLFFKSGQADAMTACFSEYSRKVLDKAKRRPHRRDMGLHGLFRSALLLPVQDWLHRPQCVQRALKEG